MQGRRQPRFNDPVDKRTSVLQATYLADRADDASTNSITVAVISTGLVYLGVVIIFLLPRCPGGACPHAKIPLVALLGLPLPALAIFSFLILLGAGAFIRSDYLLAVEEELQAVSKQCGAVAAPDFHRRSKPVFGQFADARFKVLQALSYGGAFVIVFGITAGSLWLAFRSGPHTTFGWISISVACAIYGGALATQGVVGSRLPDWAGEQANHDFMSFERLRSASDSRSESCANRGTERPHDA
jgi:multisubunit Na+/H+ antiporter MnhB subunit